MRTYEQLVRTSWFALFLSCQSVVFAADYPKTPVLEEIIVTAQKRGVENLQDVAMSAAVISKEMIGLKQLVGMDDYLRDRKSVV